MKLVFTSCLLVSMLLLLAADAFPQDTAPPNSNPILPVDEPGPAEEETARPAAADVKRTCDVAAAVLRLLVKEYESGETGIDRLELINTWSARQLQASLMDLHAFPPGENLSAEIRKSIDKHRQRMAHVAKIAADHALHGRVTKAEDAAARVLAQLPATQLDWIQRQLEKRELEMILPKVADGKPLVVMEEEVFINVDQKGRLFVAGEEYSLKEMELLLKEMAERSPSGISAVIRADKRVGLDSVVQVMNLCNRQDVKFTLTVDSE